MSDGSKQGEPDGAGLARAPDKYEETYMAGSGGVRHREKTVWKLHWILLFGPLICLVAAGMGFAGLGSKPMPLPVAFALLPLAALLALLWVTFIALRTTVTERELVIQYGLFGPRIPLDAIDDCRAVEEPLLALGGGIERVRGAWAYTLWGQGTRVVRIEWHNASGAKKATLVSSPDPDKLVAAVQRARSAGGVRIGASAAYAPGEAADRDAANEAESASKAESANEAESAKETRQRG